MPTVYVKSVPSSEWSRTVWDSATTYDVGDRVSYDDGTLNRYYECIQSHSSSVPQTNGDTYWARIGSSPEFPYYAGDGRLDSYTSGDVYLETINSRYASASSGVIWNHATEFGSTPGEIILEDGEYFQPSSALCADGIDVTAANIGKVTIQHSYFNYQYVYSAANLSDYRSKITGINLIMGGGSNIKIAGNSAKIFFDQCKLTDENSSYGPVNSIDFRIGNQNHLSFKDTLLYFPNASAPLAGNGMQQYLGELPLWENSTFAINIGNGNNYSPFIFSANTLYIKNCIFYGISTNYTTTSPIAIGGQGESNVFYTPSSSTTFTDNSDFLFLDPGFVDASKGNFSLRPSSPLIGGLQTGNILANKHPNGVWVDHNHTPAQSSYSYTLDSGDGTNYTFSGDATGTDPALNANIQDTLTFTNNTGGHPLAIYNSQGFEVASESGGTTTFTPTYADTYYYQCTVSGHENMRGDIVVSRGTLGSYGNPFGGYYDAIDAGYYDNSATLLFKEGDHELYLQNPGNYGSSNTSISSSFPGGLFFIGEDAETTRFTTGNNLNGFSAFYTNTFDSTTPQAQTPLTIESIGFHINNNTGYLNRGMFSGLHWKSFSLRFSKVTSSLTGSINSNPFDYFSSVSPAGYEFNLSGCEINLPLSDNNGPGGSFLSGNANIKYTLESCTFTKLDGYAYVHNGPSPIMVGGAFNANNGSSIKNCIFYSNVGQDFGIYSISPGVFSSCVFYSTTNSFTTLPPDMDVNSSEDPLFIRVLAGQEDLRLKPNSVSIGGLKAEPSNVYYLQPGNTYNGDGSQKDASSMTADGDAGPFNEFKEIVNSGVPYGSTIIILNGTYDWTESFGRSPSTNVSASTWYAYTLAGYNYVAETIGEVIFDAKLNPNNVFVYKPYGGPVPGPSTGTFLDLHTTFTGVQFNNMIGADNATRNQISSVSGSAGLGSCTFKNCKFLGHINTATNSSYPWTGGGRSQYSSTMHWENCEISIAFDNAGCLLGGGDGLADDLYHGGWSWKNCTFYIPTGITTFNGRNAANGTYVSPNRIFGTNYSQTQRIFKNNIIHIPNGTASIGVNGSNLLPNIENNCLNGINPVYSTHDHSDILIEKNNLLGVDPKFVDQDNFKFNLRPTSTLIGRGL